ncbi:MAG: molecular chaperone HtpG, partial [Nonlabens ulvanivorans]
ATGGGGGMMGFGNMPDMYNLVVNANHDLIQEIFNSKSDEKKASLIKQSVDLAKLSQGLLKGEALTDFVKRSYDLIK